MLFCIRMLNTLVLRKFQETFLIGTRNANHEAIHVSNHLIGRIGGQFFSCLKKEGSEPEFFYFLKKSARAILKNGCQHINISGCHQLPGACHWHARLISKKWLQPFEDKCKNSDLWKGIGHSTVGQRFVTIGTNDYTIKKSQCHLDNFHRSCLTSADISVRTGFT